MTAPFHQLAAIAYASESQIRVQLEEHSEWHDPVFFDKGGVQGFLASSDDGDLILVFRGTEPGKVEDWLANIDVAMVLNQQGEGKIHRGFVTALEQVWTKVHNTITQRNPSRIFCIGHSLGAALATLAAGILSFHGRSGLHLSTYGSPRVGSGRFARWLESRLESNRRFVNCMDVVTRVPHFALSGIYRHVGKPQYITSGGRVLDSPPFGYITFDRLMFNLKNPLKWFRSSVRHHGIMSQYVSKLGAE